MSEPRLIVSIESTVDSEGCATKHVESLKGTSEVEAGILIALCIKSMKRTLGWSVLKCAASIVEYTVEEDQTDKGIELYNAALSITQDWESAEK